MSDETSKRTCLYAEVSDKQVFRDLEDQIESKLSAQRAWHEMKDFAASYYTISKDQGATWIHYLGPDSEAVASLSSLDHPEHILTRVPAGQNFNPGKITEGELPPDVIRLEEIDKAAAPEKRFCLHARDGIDEIMALRAKLDQSVNLTKRPYSIETYHVHIGTVSLDYGETWNHYFKPDMFGSPDRYDKEKNLQAIVKVPASTTFKPKDIEARPMPTEIANLISAEQKRQTKQKTQPSSFLQRFKARKAAEREEGLER